MVIEKDEKHLEYLNWLKDGLLSMLVLRELMVIKSKIKLNIF